MASKIDICNLALSRLGDDATVSSIDPPEGSAQAEHCARFYPIALNAMLELHPWKFATRCVPLVEHAEAALRDWSHVYAVPSDSIKLLAVLPSGAAKDADTVAYEIELGESSLNILTDQAAADLRYVAAVSDTTLFSPLFTDALAWLLASYLAGSVVKGDAGAALAKSCQQSFMSVLSGAKVSDANQCCAKTSHTPQWIARR